MKDKLSSHMKLQEFCDCFATTDPLKEMSRINDEKNSNDAALKWIALAALHGINENAEKISISRSEGGHVSVTAEYRKKELPIPENDIAERIIHTVKEIAHFDENQGKIPLALGIRDSNIVIGLKMKTKDNIKKVTMKFPKQF